MTDTPMTASSREAMSDPTARGDQIAAEMRAYYERHRETWWERHNPLGNHGVTADNLMLGLFKIVATAIVKDNPPSIKLNPRPFIRDNTQGIGSKTIPDPGQNASAPRSTPGNQLDGRDYPAPDRSHYQKDGFINDYD